MKKKSNNESYSSNLLQLISHHFSKEKQYSGDKGRESLEN